MRTATPMKGNRGTIMTFIGRFIRTAFLASAVLVAGFGDPQAQTGAAPSIIFYETDQTLPAGLWRWHLNGDVMTIERNTAAANNFSTVTTSISIASNGDVTVPNDFFVTGSATVTVNTAVNGILTLGLTQSSTQDILVLDAADLVGDGQQDSHAIILTGLAYDSAAAIDADWKIFVDVTSNTGASTWTLQERIDAGGFVTAFTVDGTGNGVLENSLSVNSTFAASSGALRIANDTSLNWRNKDNDGNIGIDVDDSDVMTLGVGASSFLVQAAQVIDVTGTEALLIRKNADGGDIFKVDTTNSRILVGTPGSDGDDETVTEALVVIGGNSEIYDSGTLASESITDGGFPNSTNWAGATDWSDTMAGTTTYTHSAGSGTLTQALADLAIAGKNNRWYKLTYTVSAVTDVGANVLTITNAFAASAVTLDISSAATRSVIFQSNSSADAADFVLSATSDTASDTFTLDDVILKEITGGNQILAGKLTGGGSNGLAVDGDGDVTLDGDLRFGSSAESFVLESTGILAYKNPGASEVARSFRIHARDDGATRYLQLGTTTFESLILSGKPLGGGVWPLDLQTTVGVINFQPSGTTTRWTFGTSPYSFFPGATNSYDIGTAALAVKDYYGAGKIQVHAAGSDGDDETPPENFSFTGGNLELFDAGTLASESLQEGDFSGFTKWTDANDFNEGTGDYDYLHSAGNGTLTQALANLTIAGKNNRWYKFTYTISAFAGAATTATITSDFAASAVTLNFGSDGTRSVIFQSASSASAEDFRISVTSASGDSFTIDDVILKEIIGGNMIVAGKLTGGGSNGLSIDGDGIVTLDTDLVITNDLNLSAGVVYQTQYNATDAANATPTVDWNNGNKQVMTLDVNVTIAFTDPPGPANLLLKFIQDGGGTNTVAWPGSVQWEGGAAPVISAGAADIDIITFYFDGTNYFGAFLQDFS